MKKVIMVVATICAMCGCAGVKERAYQAGFYDAEQLCYESNIRLVKNQGLTKEQAEALMEGHHDLMNMRRISIGIEVKK